MGESSPGTTPWPAVADEALGTIGAAIADVTEPDREAIGLHGGND